MSDSLYMVPVVPLEGTRLPDALRFILRENEEWTPAPGYAVDRVCTESDIPYLKGLRDAKVAGAAFLIDAIEHHGAVRVWTEG